MAEAVIQAERLCCQSGRHYLLKDVCWKVEAGEHWIVFGLNGSGKTTLLSIIAGFKQYTDGFLQVLGQTYTNENVLSLSKQIGWVSASYFDKYYTNETVLQIVLSGLLERWALEQKWKMNTFIKHRYCCSNGMWGINGICLFLCYPRANSKMY